MKWMIIAIVEFVAIIAVVVVAINYHDRLIASQNDILVLSGEKETLRELNLILENDKIILQSDKLVLERNKLLLENNIKEITKKNDNLDLEIEELNLKIDELETKLKGALPFTSGNRQIQITNQDNTHNPTWSELKNFLSKDNTDKLKYVKDVFECGNFAQTLHDNSELAGIRCGIVEIDFVVPPGHGLNIFYTTDEGFVYIDDTEPIVVDSECLFDSVAYIEVGKEYGIIDIDKSSSFSYSYYETMKRKHEQYGEDVLQLNISKDNYEKYISSPFVDWVKAENWRQEINAEVSRVNRERDDLPECWSDSAGIVSAMEIYW